VAIDTRRLLDRYGAVVGLLNDKFVEWDDALRAAEASQLASRRKHDGTSQRRQVAVQTVAAAR
jgi:hypothetical protein